MAPLTKVLVLGVDGGEPSFFDAWARDGDLPNIERLLTTGLRGRTRNPRALEAGAVWPAFHTGLNPGRQPQYDGLRYFDAATYANRWYDADDVEPNIWRRLSDQGQRVLVIDTPYARLDPSLNGAMILDWGAHVPADGERMALQTHPASLKEEVLAVVGPDPTGGVMCDERTLETTQDYREFVQSYLERIEKKAQLAVHMLNKGGWDYTEIVFTDLHCIGHHTWHVSDPDHPKHAPALQKALGHPLRAAYRALDAAIGTILDVLDEQTTVLFYTSHGMGPQYTGTGLLDRILDRLENPKPRGESRPLKARLQSAWLSVPGAWRAALQPLRKPFKGALAIEQFLPAPQTRRAFEVYANNATGAVRVNLVGREPNGVVPQDEYRPFLEGLRDKLLSFTNKDTGAPFIEEAIITRDLYGGAYVEQLPDLLLTWNRTAPIRVVESPFTGPLQQDYAGFRTGDHTPHGLFAATGPQVRPMTLNEDVLAVDFAPTLAALLGADAGPTDGRMITGFEPDQDAVCKD